MQVKMWEIKCPAKVESTNISLKVSNFKYLMYKIYFPYNALVHFLLSRTGHNVDLSRIPSNCITQSSENNEEQSHHILSLL